MRALVQRVSKASVRVEGVVRGEIGRGFVVLVGVAPGDTHEVAARLAEKAVALRVFEDEAGRMNRSLAEVAGEVLAVSQFTLFADTRRGNRPSFTGAAGPEHAEPLYETFCAAIESEGIRCARGVFGAHMDVTLTNDGPVTILLDSAEMERPRRG